MTKYHVHVYPMVEVLVRDIEAESQEEACRKAEAARDWSALLKSEGVEWAQVLDGFLVDEDGDTEHAKSTWYDNDYLPG